MSIDSIAIILSFIFLLCVFGLIGVVIWFYRTNSQNRMKNRVKGFIDTKDENEELFLQNTRIEPFSQDSKFEGVRGKINQTLSVFSTNELRLKISSAYWPISDIEFIFIRIAVTLIGIALGWLISKSIIGGIGLGILFYLLPGIFLERAIVNRRKKFQDQLLNFLVLIKGAVLAGYSLMQALNMAIKEIPAPTSEEFSQVLREVKFGFPLEQALRNLTGRMESDDLQIVVTAIMLNAQMGGSLATVLEATIDTVRERIHLLGEIRSLTSYARFVGWLVSILPFATGLFIYLTNPSYFDTVMTSSITRVALIMALISVIFGNILIRRIMKIRV